jgi:predicted PurR-regulated permease PerM
MNTPSGSDPVKIAIEIAVNLSLIFIILAWCLQILSPFISLIVWAAVIAVAMYKPFLKLQGLLGGRRKLAIALFAILGLAVVIVPAWLFVGSILESTEQVRTALESGQVELAPPGDNVRDWPVVGEGIYENWLAASENLEGWLSTNSETVKKVLGGVFGKLTGIGVGALQFAISILIAAAFIANADAMVRGMDLLTRRIVGDRANDFLMLSSSTVTSVAVGVLGIAFIQAVLAGIGMVAVGVPAAGILALLVLILAIAQLPPWLILLPVIFYVYSVEDSTIVATVFAVWSLAVSFADMVLKPLMLGRGVEAPMLVILLGAIGGMITSGIIGLFVGAVVLALGYKLLEAWLKSGAEKAGDETAEVAAGEG